MLGRWEVLASQPGCAWAGGETPHAESCKQLVQACKALSSGSRNCWGETLRQTSLPKEGSEWTPNKTVCPSAVPHLYPNPTVSSDISFGTRRRKLISLSRRTAAIFLCLPPQLRSALYCWKHIERFCVHCDQPNASHRRQSLPSAIYSLIFFSCLPPLPASVYNQGAEVGRC